VSLTCLVVVSLEGRLTPSMNCMACRARALAKRSGVVDGADARVLEARCDLCSWRIPCHGSRIREEVGRKDLQGNPAVEGDLQGLIERYHAAATQLPEDLVLTDESSGGGRFLRLE